MSPSPDRGVLTWPQNQVCYYAVTITPDAFLHRRETLDEHIRTCPDIKPGLYVCEVVSFPIGTQRTVFCVCSLLVWLTILSMFRLNLESILSCLQTLAIQKAINSIETPVKEKHVRSTIIGTFQEQSAITYWVSTKSLQGMSNELKLTYIITSSTLK